VFEIPLNPPHVPQLHVVHSPHAIDAHPANHADDSQVLFLSMDNTPASAKGFQNGWLATLDDHAETIPSPQLFRGFIRPCHGVLQGQQIGTRKRLWFADFPVWAVGNPHNLPTADRDSVSPDLRAQRCPVVSAFVEKRNDSPKWCVLLTRDLEQDGWTNGQKVKAVLFDCWM
jgi:hypothetical protein